MPYLSIKTNVEIDEDARMALLARASQTVAEMLGKPESYVMVHLQDGCAMTFAGDPAPLAYLQLKSLGLPEGQTGAFSKRLCGLMRDALSIDPARVYIEFSSPPRPMWGWNEGTF